MAGPTLNVSLTAHLQEVVGALLSTGRYQTASEVIRAGLRLLEKFEETAGTSVDVQTTGACPVCGMTPVAGHSVASRQRDGRHAAGKRKREPDE